MLLGVQRSLKKALFGGDCSEGNATKALMRTTLVINAFAKAHPSQWEEAERVKEVMQTNVRECVETGIPLKNLHDILWYPFLHTFSKKNRDAQEHHATPAPLLSAAPLFVRSRVRG